MSHFRADKCYLLQTLSRTKHTQCRHSGNNRAWFWEIHTIPPYCFWHPTFFQLIKFFMLLYMAFYRLAVYSVIWLWVTHRLPLWEWLFFQINSIKTSKLQLNMLWLIFKYFNLSMMKAASILSLLSYWSSKISVNIYFILLVVEKIYPLSCPIFRHQLLRLVPW